jgi:hypothetical protein
MSSTQVIARDPGESYDTFRVRASNFLDDLPGILGDMHDADRLILEDSGVVDGGRSVTLTIVKNAVDTSSPGR